MSTIDMSKNEALDKKAENARELGLDYEPAPVQQEPEWYHFVRHGDDCFVPYKGQAPANATALYTSPPAQRKPWVELDHDDIHALMNEFFYPGMQPFGAHFANFAKAIETKLKEKNSGN